MTEATIAAVCAGRKAGLGLNGIDAWLQSGKIGPTAAIQGKFANRSGLDGGADVRTRQLHRRRFSRDFHAVGHRSDLQRQVEFLLRSDVNFDSSFNFCVESGSRNSDLIFSGQKIRGNIETIFISGDCALDSGRQILDYDLRIRDFRSGFISDGAGQRTSGNLRERSRCIDGQRS